MWKDYSWSYIKRNRASSISVVVAAFISALLLSLICSLFYNFWKYDIEEIKLEEGDWQGRLVGKFNEEDLDTIQSYGNVEKALVNHELSGEQDMVVDVYFTDMRTILKDMPLIADSLGLSPDAAVYHHSLLSMYLIRDPQDPAPRLVFPLFLAVTAMACFSLILIIHNAFAITMNARIHQFGIFSSIGASPGQILTCLLQEAAFLCAVPVLAGIGLGITISALVMKGANAIAADAAGRHDADFAFHPLVLVFILVLTVLTILVSAWLPAGKLSRLNPIEAISNTAELQLKKKKSSRILTLLFGMEGELAGNALKAQRKALRTSTLALTFSFLAFTLMQCFFTLSGISTRMTYFEKYQDVWDVMATVKKTEIEAFEKADELKALSGVEHCAVYQKAEAKRVITEDEISGAFHEMGGFENAREEDVTAIKEGWLVNAPIVILDDGTFLEYCRQTGAEPRLNGAVILNRIRDIHNPNFRNPVYYQYIKEEQDKTILCQAKEGGLSAEVPVLSYTQEVPKLREEYGDLDYYELVHFIPVSLWRQIKGQIEGAKEDTYIRVLAEDKVTLTGLNMLEEEIEQTVTPEYEIESENRIEAKVTNDRMIRGMMLILGGFCVLLAIIGIGNVFSNTLGFVRQRRREFARYMSVGLTPGGIKKMFCIEAMVIAGRPVLITLPLSVIAAAVMIQASYLEPVVFVKEMPVIPVSVFLICIFGFVALAYYLGGRMILKSNMADALREDALV